MAPIEAIVAAFLFAAPLASAEDMGSKPEVVRTSLHEMSQQSDTQHFRAFFGSDP